MARRQPAHLPDHFADFIEEFAQIIRKHKSDVAAFFSEVEPIYQELLTHREFLGSFFARLATDNEFLRAQLVVMEPNEFVLYYHPEGAFSLRLYIWDDFVYSYIHDHGSWGIYAAWVNAIRVVNYRRLDDGADREYAELEIDRHFTLEPGNLSYVLPFDAGIHMIGGDQGMTITLNVYGPTHRRGYINRFDLHKKSVTRIFTPRLEKRLLAVRALGDIRHEATRDTLERTAADEYPMVRWESISSLEKIDPQLHLKLLRRALEDPSRRLRARAQRELERRGEG